MVAAIHLLTQQIHQVHQASVVTAYTNLDERRFRELGSFCGNEEEWKEFALKFRATVKEVNPKLHLLIKWAEIEPDEITGNRIGELHGEDGTIGTAMLHNKLIHHLKGPPLTIHQTVMGENGQEVWRRLMNRFNPMTPMRGLQIMLKVMMPPKIGKQLDDHGMVNTWEGLVHVLERDYKENISDMMKIGILIHVMPEELQDSTSTRSMSTSWSKRKW